MGVWICGTTPTFPTPQDCRGTNKVLRWNATTSSWICGNVAPTPQHCRGGTKALRWDSNASSWICGNVVTSTTATPPNCEVGQALTYTDNQWSCLTEYRGDVFRGGTFRGEAYYYNR